MLNLRLYKDKRIRLYELEDMDDYDNLIDLKYTQLSITANKMIKELNELNALIFERRTAEYNFLMSRDDKKNKKRKR